MNKPALLIVEDDEFLARAYAEFLSCTGCHIEVVHTGQQAISYLQMAPPAILLLDLGLPDIHGLEVLEHIRRSDLKTKVIIVTSENSADSAMDAVRMGAYDYMLKPLDQPRLLVIIRKLLEQLLLEEKLSAIEKSPRNHYCGFVGSSAPMQVVYRIIDNVATSNATVFITGESGTGKELCAEAIHRQSSRAQLPFVALNCAAIPRDLLESEIFGYVKGAFTGALQPRKGAAAQANGGTLFLDEICEMDLELQTKLLRFIQTRQYRPVGATQEECVDVRFVCATNRDPWHEVRAGRFREDLYYRLYVVPIDLPPLRNRDQDVLILAHHFLRQYSLQEGKHFEGFSHDAVNILLTQAFPGNVRELQNIIRRIVVLHKGGLVTHSMLDLKSKSAYSDLCEPAKNKMVTEAEHSGAPIRRLADVEREYIEQAISQCNGSVIEAARHLGVSDSTLYRKLNRWGKSI
ncbi:Regulatory protein LuxO [Nitrincola lacisaponensis]|uniref:Regulatory protein LuxO n=1 Tax=Nitrincola lacisaponensis TaxID=267850 RepID=A0A063Y3F1_9GAMM|nr:sigma-54 dependent transcriptional regulator [Nitrincola lacisaponensis]KDE39012.1 Regulatory protein LuxO [Nitrincola lacisaponensis]